jgi:hypothetical protein
MEAAKSESGYGGVTVLPVSAGKQHPTGKPTPGMEPAFLSDNYFSRYLDILEAAKKRGMQVILYDDIDFPSGSAGQLMRERYPNDRLKYLEKTDTLVHGSSTLNLILRDDPVMAVVAMNVKTFERLNLSGYVTDKKLHWKSPPGDWKVMVFYCVQTNHKLVDFMSPAAVAKYLPLTYGAYEKHFKDYFGTTIRQIFYDDVGYVAKERGWTPEFNRKFKERYGKDPDLLYPALFEDIGPEPHHLPAGLLQIQFRQKAMGFLRSARNRLPGSGGLAYQEVTPRLYLPPSRNLGEQSM